MTREGRERLGALLVAGKHHYTPAPTAWGRGLLNDYAVYDGFAIRRGAVPEVRRPSASPGRR